MSREDVEVAFNIELETRKLSQRMVAFDRSIQKTSISVDKLSQIGKAMGKDYAFELARSQRDINRFRSTVETSHTQILKAREALAGATSDLERKEIEDRIKMHEREKVRAIASARMVAKESSRALQEKIGSLKLSDMASELATIKPNFSEYSRTLAEDTKDGLMEGFSSFKGKDLPGLIKAMGSVGKNLLKGSGSFAGAALLKHGAGMSAKGNDLGGAQGTALKMVGSVMTKVGPMLGTLAKMGPLLSMSASIFAGIVKTMIDVESQAKQINKELMEGGALADTFAASGNNAVASMSALSDQLQEIKDQAHSVKMNLAMGTQAKDHLGVVNVLKREGLSLKALSDRLEENKNISKAAAQAEQKNLAGLAQSMTKYTGLTSMAIAYSRSFGVSLDEIGTLQGELMSELSTSATDLALDFSRMQEAAVQSGIGVTKFFNLIRGVSQDLSLYGMRLKDVTKTLGLMGKTMSPRTAQKFMQTLTQGFKGKSMVDRVKSALLGGGNVTQAASEDVAEKMNDLIQEVADKGGKSLEEARRALESGQVQGPEREAYLRLQRRQKSLNEGGVLGTAAAMEDMGPAATFEAVKAAMLRFGGGKDLKSMTNMGMLATEQATGYSTEEQTQAMLFEQSLEDQKKLLKTEIKNGTLDAKKREKLEKLGIRTVEDVDKASTNKIYRTMDKSSEDQAKEAEAQLKAAYESGKLSQSMLDKMDVIIDALFNWLYKIMSQIFDVMEDIWNSMPGGDAETKRMGKILSSVMKDRNKDLIDVASNTTSESQFKAKALESTDTGKSFLDAIRNGIATRDSANKEAISIDAQINDASTDPDKKVALRKRLAELEAIRNASNDKYLSATKALNDQVGGKGTEEDKRNLRKDRLFKSFSDGDKDLYRDQISKSFQALEEGADLSTALQKGGFSDKQSADILERIAREQMRGEQLGKALSDYSKNIPKEDDKTAKALQDIAKDQAKNLPPAPEAPKDSLGQLAAEQTKGLTTEQQNQAMLAAEAKKEKEAKEAQRPQVTPPNPPPVPAFAPASIEKPPVPTPAKPLPVSVEVPPTEKTSPLGIKEMMVQAPAVVNQLAGLAEMAKTADENVQAGFNDIWDAMRRRGVKLDHTATDTIEKGALDSLRKALFEFALYSSDEPKDLIDKMKEMGGAVGNMAYDFDDDPANEEFLKRHSEGGIVTSIRDGIAQTKRLPAGEGLASIGPGEKIVPTAARGGGGQGGPIILQVNGIGGQDLANFLRVKIVDGIYEYKRREKFT